MAAAESIVTIVEFYLMAGLIVAAFFLIFGIERVEPGSQGAYAFRPLLIPGLSLLWPLVIYRWWVVEQEMKAKSASQGDEA